MPGTLNEKPPSPPAEMAFEVRAGGDVVGPVSLDRVRRGWLAGKIPPGAEVRAISAERETGAWRPVHEVLQEEEARPVPEEEPTIESAPKGIAPRAWINASVRLVRQLGAGGMGSVWLAEHVGLETQVAVKLVRAELVTEQPDAVARFRREAAAAAKIRNPHVVQMLDHGVTADGTAYIVMELLEGETLGARIARLGRLAPDDVAAVIVQVAKALTAAHALGIVHRDIKPENIVLTTSAGELVVKVLDFGIAKQSMAGYDALTAASSLVGTPEYMSPEQIVSARDVDHGADIWALGVVAFEALTGRVPFAGETVGGLIVAITTSNFTPPSALGLGLPAELDGFFARAFGRAMDSRFASPRALADALQRTLANAVVPPSHQLGAGPTGTQPGGARPSMPVAPTMPGLPLELESPGEDRTVVIAPAVRAPTTLGGAARTILRGHPDGRLLAVAGAAIATVALTIAGAVALLRGPGHDTDAAPAAVVVAPDPAESTPAAESTAEGVASSVAAPVPMPSATAASASASAKRPPAPSTQLPRDRKGRLGF